MNSCFLSVLILFRPLSMLSFYGRNPRDSLLADEGSAGLRVHERLSDQEPVKTGQNSLALIATLQSCVKTVILDVLTK